MINNFLKIIKKNGAKIIFIQSIIFISFFISNLGSFTRKNLELYFFDIGQGDSIFIRTTDNIDILIDSGPNGEVVSQLGSVMPFWDRKIDLVILTHPDLDHIGGLPDILKYYEIENILFTGIDHESNTYQYLLDEIDSLNIQKLGFR
ncbi:MAG TPA: MBL fold metallo-hydrolase, partial [Candidatus Dojkabacteria bacterium]